MPLPSINQASNPGGFSDNFKEKASALKDKFLPKNLLNGLFGKTNTDNNNKLGSDTSGQKNPQRTSIGSGSNTRLKMRDSIADIMAKQYMFMQKSYEADKERDEIQDAYRQEQIEEDERRHKKLIESLKNVKTPTAVPEKEKEKSGDSSIIGKMLGGIKSALGLVLSPMKKAVMFLAGMLETVFSALGNIGLKVAGLLAKTPLMIFSAIFPLLSQFVSGAIGFVMKFIFRSMASAMSGIAGATGKLGAALKIGLAAFGLSEASDAFFDYNSLMQFGSDASDTQDEINKLKEEQKVLAGQYGKIVGNPHVTNERKQSAKDALDAKQKEILEKQALMQKQRADYYKDVLIPHMESLGYTYHPNSGDSKGTTIPKFTDKDGKEVVPMGETFLKAAAGLPIQQFGQKFISKQMENGKGALSQGMDLFNGAFDSAREKLNNFKVDDVKRDIGVMVDPVKDAFEEGRNAVISKKQINNINGSASVTIREPMSARPLTHEALTNATSGNAARW
jgi:hypothetical protein